MESWTVLSDIVILLIGSLLLGGIFSRLGQSPLVGYLVAGMILGGPGSVGAIQSQEAIEGIAELGVSLLLFSIALEFSLSRLASLGTRRLIAGVVQVLITTALGAGVAMLAGVAVTEAIAIGAMISLSSTAVVLRILMERAEIDSPHGRNTLAILLVQDMAVVPLALLVTLLPGGGSVGEVFLNIGRTLLMTVGLIAGLYLLLNKVAVYALGALTLERNRELTIILAVATGLGSAWAAHSMGVSPALGAFIAGMFLGSSPFATQIRADISSLRVVLLTLFFGAAGMVADPLWIFQHWYLVLGVLVLLTIGKTLIIWPILQFLGQYTSVAAASAICLAQIGEFAFVLGTLGRDAGVVSEDTYRLVVSVTIASLMCSAFILPAAPWLGGRLSRLVRGSGPLDPPGHENAVHGPDVILVGFGPAAQIASLAFRSWTDRVLVIDLNRAGVERARELGFRGMVGDATDSDVIEHAELHSAKVIVITVPHLQTALGILSQVRRQAPHVHVVVRSRYQLHAHDFANAGAHVVIGDEEQVGDALRGHLVEWIEKSEPPPSDNAAMI